MTEILIHTDDLRKSELLALKKAGIITLKVSDMSAAKLLVPEMSAKCNDAISQAALDTISEHCAKNPNSYVGANFTNKVAELLK